MTKKELKWRLKELPTGDEVAELVAQGVITKEEARKLLFNEDKEDSDKLKARHEEIKFLRELVDKLASKHNGWTTIYHEYYRIKPHYPVWYSNYGPLMQTYSSNAIGANTTTTAYTPNTGTFTSGGNIQNLMSTSSQNMKGLSSLN